MTIIGSGTKFLASEVANTGRYYLARNARHYFGIHTGIGQNLRLAIVNLSGPRMGQVIMKICGRLGSIPYRNRQGSNPETRA
jgi:hypothetical protein